MPLYFVFSKTITCTRYLAFNWIISFNPNCIFNGVTIYYAHENTLQVSKLWQFSGNFHKQALTWMLSLQKINLKKNKYILLQIWLCIKRVFMYLSKEKLLHYYVSWIFSLLNIKIQYTQFRRIHFVYLHISDSLTDPFWYLLI